MSEKKIKQAVEQAAEKGLEQVIEDEALEQVTGGGRAQGNPGNLTLNQTLSQKID